MDLLQTKLNPDCFTDNPLTLAYGLTSHWNSSSSSNSVKVTIPQINGYNFAGLVVNGFYCVAPATPTDNFATDQAALLTATALIRPTPSLGAHALFRSITVSTQQGTNLVCETNYPQSVLLQNEQLMGQTNEFRNLGNNIAFTGYAVPLCPVTTLSQALIPFAVQPRLSLPAELQMETTGPIEFNFQLAAPQETFLMPVGAFPVNNGTLAQPQFVGIADGIYTTPGDANNQYYPVVLETQSRVLSNYTVLSYLRFQCYHVRSSSSSGSMEYEKKLITAYRLPVQSSVNQSWNLPMLGVCASDIQTRLQDQRLPKWACFNRWAPVCSAGTYVKYSIHGLESYVTYPTQSFQPSTQTAITLSTDDRQILEYSRAERNTLINRSHGRYERLYFAEKWGFNSSRVDYNKQLTNFNRPYLDLTALTFAANVTTATPYSYGSQEVNIQFTPPASLVTNAGMVPALISDAFNYARKVFDTTLLPLPSYTAGIARVGNAYSYIFGINGPYAGTNALSATPVVWSVLPIPSQGAYPLYLALDYTSTMHLVTTNTYRLTSISSTGVSTAPATSSSTSTRGAYSFNNGGAEAHSATQIIRYIPMIQVPPIYQGNVAFEVQLPNSGNIISAHIMTTPVPVCEQDGAPTNLPELTTVGGYPGTSALGAACGRICPSHIGQASWLRAVSLYDEVSSVLDNQTALTRSIEMIGWSHDEKARYRALVQGGNVFTNTPRAYSLQTHLDDSIRYDAICHPRDSVFKWTGYTDFASSALNLKGPASNFYQDMYSTANNQQRLWINCRHASNLWDQMENVPCQPNRRIRFELNQQPTWVAPRSAGGGALASMQRDPFQEARLQPLFAPSTTAQLQATPPQIPYNRIQPRINFVATGQGAPILVLRLGYDPNQGEIADRLYREAPPQIVLPRSISFPSYLNLALPNVATGFANSSFNVIQASSTMYSTEQYPIGSQPEAVVIQTFAGFKDPSDQRPDVPPTVIPWNAYGMGMCGYSLSPFSTNVVPDKLGYIETQGPYISPLVDGASLRTTLPNFGDWMSNVYEFKSITGVRAQVPFESVCSLPPPYFNLEPVMMSGIRKPVFTAASGTTPASFAVGTMDTPTGINMRGASVMETPFQYMVRYPACHDYIFVELGSRVRGREYLTLNWQFNGAPLTNQTGGALNRYLMGWGVLPFPSALVAAGNSLGSPATMVNAPQVLLWQASMGLAYGTPTTFTQLVHLFSHETFRIGIDGIKRMEAAF